MITVGGTALAAVAAIGGLWAQAVSSYWSQQTAKDQLSQSRDNAEQERQGQARLVSYWMEKRDGYGTRRVHIMNRSQDPVFNVAVAIQVWWTEKGEDRPPMIVHEVYGDLGPCTEIIYIESEFRIGVPGDLRKMPASVEGDGMDVLRLIFIDRASQPWKRKGGRLSTHVTEVFRNPPRDAVLGTAGKPAVRKLSDCTPN